MHIDTNVHVHFATWCIFVFEDDENKATGLQFLPLKVSFVLVLDYIHTVGAHWLSGRVLDSRPRGHRFEPHRRHCVVVLEQDTFILALYWFNPGRPVPV